MQNGVNVCSGLEIIIKMKKDDMRHNSNSRRPRSRSNGSNSSPNRSSSNSTNNNNNRRVNPRVQTFDSNGPEVRVRGTAYQINEKYITLARDAASVGDRVLAESCLQHAEHYQRFINEMTERNEQYMNQQKRYEQPSGGGEEHQQPEGDDKQPLDDLDQGFLIGDRDDGAAEDKLESGNASDNANGGSDESDDNSSFEEEAPVKRQPVRRVRKSAAVQKENPEA